MNLFITLALINTATIYGYGEKFCGEPERPVPCDIRAITASGEGFNPSEISAAIPLPRNKIMRTFYLHVKDYRGKCIKLKVNDKKNWRYIGNGGLDLTPAAVMAITGKLPNRFWSGKLEVCK